MVRTSGGLEVKEQRNVKPGVSAFDDGLRHGHSVLFLIGRYEVGQPGQHPHRVKYFAKSWYTGGPSFHLGRNRILVVLFFFPNWVKICESAEAGLPHKRGNPDPVCISPGMPMIVKGLFDDHVERDRSWPVPNQSGRMPLK